MRIGQPTAVETPVPTIDREPDRIRQAFEEQVSHERDKSTLNIAMPYHETYARCDPRTGPGHVRSRAAADLAVHAARGGLAIAGAADRQRTPGRHDFRRRGTGTSPTQRDLPVDRQRKGHRQLPESGRPFPGPAACISARPISPLARYFNGKPRYLLHGGRSSVLAR